jgi:hypothetical protein
MVTRVLVVVVMIVTSAGRASETDPADCPAWAKASTPDWVRPYMGKQGLGEPFVSSPKVLGKSVAGIDRWQANHFVVYREETKKYLYEEYTPTRVEYVRGALPGYEAVVERYTKGVSGDRERAVALLTVAMPAEMRHPTMAPLGPECRADRNMLDGPLLSSGTGFCNEQARVFVRLCQVAGIPARVVFLFYSDKRTGHTIAEFYADGRWCMADASWFCVFPGADGKLMSAVECHDPANGKWVAKAYRARFDHIVALDNEALVGLHVKDGPDRAKQVHERAARIRKEFAEKTEQYLETHLWQFGVVNYPLPPVGAR